MWRNVAFTFYFNGGLSYIGELATRAKREKRRVFFWMLVALVVTEWTANPTKAEIQYKQAICVIGEITFFVKGDEKIH